MIEFKSKKNVFILLGICFVVSTLAQFYFAKIDPTENFNFRNTRIVQANKSDLFVKKLPFVADPDRGAKFPETFKVFSEFSWNENMQSLLEIVPDDCIQEIWINDKKVDETDSLSKSNLCDFKNGIAIEIGKYALPGANSIKITMQNTGGPFGVNLRAANKLGVAKFLVLFLKSLLLLPLLLFGMFFNRKPYRMIWLTCAAIQIFLTTLFFVSNHHRPNAHVYSDMAFHVDIGKDIAQGHFQEKHTFKPIGYGFILSVLGLKNGETITIVTHALCMAGSFFVGFLLIGRFFGWRIAFTSFALLSSYFPFYHLAGFYLPETIYMFLIILSIYLISGGSRSKNWKIILSGLILQLSIWIRGNHLFLLPIIPCFWLLGELRRTEKFNPIFFCKRVLLFVCPIVFGFLLHYAVTSVFYLDGKFLSSNGGLNLIEGKCPSKDNEDKTGMGWLSPLFAQLDEGYHLKWDEPFKNTDYFTKEALKCIQYDPKVLVTSFRFIFHTFFGSRFWPGSDRAIMENYLEFWNMIYEAFIFPGFFLGFLWLIARPWKGNRIFLAPVLANFLCLWITKGEIRYRIPFDLFQIPIAVVGFYLMGRVIGDRWFRYFAPGFCLISALAQSFMIIW